VEHTDDDEQRGRRLFVGEAQQEGDRDEKYGEHQVDRDVNAQAGLLGDKRTELDVRLSERREVLP